MKRIKVALTMVAILALTSCENSDCPEGTEPVRDFEGNIIDCFGPGQQIENIDRTN